MIYKISLVYVLVYFVPPKTEMLVTGLMADPDKEVKQADR